MVKYFICAILAFIVIMTLLAYPGSEESALLLLAFFLFVVSCLAYKYIKLILFVSKVKKCLKKKNKRIIKTHLYFQKACIIAQDDSRVYDICLIIRKRSYYRYHFYDADNIEFYKSSRATSLRGSRGMVARGAVYSRLVGKQKISHVDYNTEKEKSRILIINKFPYAITDSVRREELGNKDRICSSDVVLFDLNGFIRYVEE